MPQGPAPASPGRDGDPARVPRERGDPLHDEEPVPAPDPMTGVVDGFRWALLGKPESPGLPFLVSMAAVSLLLVGGLFYFRRMERSFADVV